MTPGAVDFNKAAYMLAAHYPQQWPQDTGAEAAFAGRSNVGKSSAINAITGRRGLAKTSKTPGRTRQIVFFELDPAMRLVDLPGYGYAKAPAALRQHWQTFLTRYLYQRECLKGLVVPMDIRRPLTQLDMIMLECCWGIDLPAHVLLTKADKFKRGKAMHAFQSVKKSLADKPRTTVQLFSARSGQGVADAREVLAVWLRGG